MKFTTKEEKTVDIKYLEFDVLVRYPDEDITPPNILNLENGIWKATIDLEEKRILDWNYGVAIETFAKICDGGFYRLLDADKNVVKELKNSYVPNDILNGKYGDYLELKIDEKGYITNWLSNANLSDFETEED